MATIDRADENNKRETQCLDQAPDAVVIGNARNEDAIRASLDVGARPPAGPIEAHCWISPIRFKYRSLPAGAPLAQMGNAPWAVPANFRRDR
jgi:hypothetical protein